jgi:hypothetical protein
MLRALALPFRPFRGFTSGTAAHGLAEDSVGDDERPLVCLYLGDWDPSGLFMSDQDLPQRIQRYGGDVELKRIALIETDLPSLPTHFDVSTKAGDPRAPWFRKRFGTKYYELDALDPEALRERVRIEAKKFIDEEAWDRVEIANQAVAGSLAAVMKGWNKKATSIFDRVQE